MTGLGRRFLFAKIVLVGALMMNTASAAPTRAEWFAAFTNRVANPGGLDCDANPEACLAEAGGLRVDFRRCAESENADNESLIQFRRSDNAMQ